MDLGSAVLLPMSKIMHISASAELFALFYYTYVYYTGWNPLSRIVISSNTNFSRQVCHIVPKSKILEQLPKPPIESEPVLPVSDMCN